MDSKVVLITGANTGIGYQIVRTLYGSGQAYKIIVGAMSISKAGGAINSAKEEFPSSQSELSSVIVDIEDDDAIKNAFETVKSKFGKLDALINNAGTVLMTAAQLDPQFMAGKMSERDLWNQSWNTNVSGTQVMTSTFVPLLLESSDPRLQFITSGTSTLAGADNLALPVNRPLSKGWPKTGFRLSAYRSAKTGMNMLMREWHRMLKEDGVKVWCISPGFLATGLGGNTEFTIKMGAGDPVVAGPFIRSVLEGQRDDDVGKVINKDGVQPW